ncbi:hypothetical protein AtNW77_Chr1g0079971 [Arabidopsis thaliana]|jgi:hypothetical protein|uniref:Uncharacterized protein n=4 Tax=Arabidopsis TaxID=3701 RepID=A0A178WIL8_ARATH|nr:uncharacterized protein AT1G77885 [Arabidopsis thaliana]KAG7652091.1 hypothetical protein ISN45_At01g068750 [Arabidopsis thaliana x Arabidopsis arenosa]KAG7659953.1 hypothetical protein ISN44_As01g067600 [Arabidopsis suecica]AEE36040.1 hypothetical protein AT1G77885 [Arabidopsis thaliana]OAP17591.1 hypothetical protein AXX17_AT1G72480 [Arabidopsis thaliana]CAA0340440.1 unnamed protein product [Arabidopsis thaliana]|eukprot:NP_974165.1 hypothetical protein AT1G77885 [Arabidopsis thaliana]
MSLAIAEVYTVRKFHRESMKKPAKQTVTGEGDEKIGGGSFKEAPVKSGGCRRFGRWFFGKPGMKKSSAKVSDPMAIE